MDIYETTDGKFDLVLLRRVLDGFLSHKELSREEKVYIAQHFGGSASRVGKALGVTEKTVIRWRGESQ